MKKFFAVVLALVMVIALAACGQESAPVSAPEPVAEETPAPVEPTPAAVEEPAEPVVRETEEVEITAENFLDYFEFVKEADYDNAEKDSDGNIVSLNVHYDYKLKEGYEAAYQQRSDDEKVIADVNVTYTSHLNPQNVNFEELSFELGDDATEQSFSTSFNAEWWNEDGTICENPEETDGAEYKMTVLEFPFGVETINDLNTIEITAASGTLVLFK